MKLDSTWKKSEEELPPCDGFYEISNDPSDPEHVGVAKYDGYAFDYLGIYREPKFWRATVEKNKRYGKIIDGNCSASPTI